MARKESQKSRNKRGRVEQYRKREAKPASSSAEENRNMDGSFASTVSDQSAKNETPHALREAETVQRLYARWFEINNGNVATLSNKDIAALGHEMAEIERKMTATPANDPRDLLCKVKIAQDFMGTNGAPIEDGEADPSRDILASLEADLLRIAAASSAPNSAANDTVVELGLELAKITRFLKLSGEIDEDGLETPDGLTPSRLGHGGWDRARELMSSIASLRARTFDGAIAQIIVANFFVVDLVDIELEKEKTEERYRQLFGILYSVMDLLEKHTGRNRREFGGDYLMYGYMNPLAEADIAKALVDHAPTDLLAEAAKQ